MWATQAQIDEDIPDKIQELKTAIKWVGDQLIDVQKQVMLKCDWNSTQFCVTPVHFNNSAYNWEQIKFHLQNIHDVRKYSSFILLQVVDQFFRDHLLKRLSFSHCIFLLPL